MRKQQCKGYIMCPPIAGETHTSHHSRNNDSANTFLLVYASLISPNTTVELLGESFLESLLTQCQNHFWPKNGPMVLLTLLLHKPLLTRRSVEAVYTPELSRQLIQWLCMSEMVLFRISEEYSFYDQQTNFKLDKAY